jgi:hypothetical protein
MKTEQEIYDLLYEAAEMDNFAGMTYKDGIMAALDWVLNRSDEKPTE